MATMKLDAGISTRSIAGEEGDPDPDPEETANQHSDSDPGADKVSDIVQLDLSVSKDDTDPPALQYPALEASMEPSSSPVMSVSLARTRRLLHD